MRALGLAKDKDPRSCKKSDAGHEKGFSAEDSAVFVLAAEPPHSVTKHVANDPEGILDSICSAMSTIANNNAVSSGHCAVVIGPEHAIAAKGWTRHDVRNYLAMHAYNLFSEITFNERYDKIYNRNLPKCTSASQRRASRSYRAPTTSTFSSLAAQPDDFPLSSQVGSKCPPARHRDRRRAQHADLRRWHLLSLRRSKRIGPVSVYRRPRGSVAKAGVQPQNPAALGSRFPVAFAGMTTRTLYFRVSTASASNWTWSASETMAISRRSNRAGGAASGARLGNSAVFSAAGAEGKPRLFRHCRRCRVAPSGEVRVAGWAPAGTASWRLPVFR